MSRIVLFDNEAVQALGDRSHLKHQQVLSQAQFVTNRKLRAEEFVLAVPLAVRVEAGWDRTSASWAFANRLRIVDIPLDGPAANLGATIRSATGVSVADAHLGAVIRTAAVDHVTVVTSDPDDMRLLAGDTPITVVTV